MTVALFDVVCDGCGDRLETRARSPHQAYISATGNGWHRPVIRKASPGIPSLRLDLCPTCFDAYRKKGDIESSGSETNAPPP